MPRPSGSARALVLAFVTSLFGAACAASGNDDANGGGAGDDAGATSGDDAGNGGEHDSGIAHDAGTGHDDGGTSADSASSDATANDSSSTSDGATDASLGDGGAHDSSVTDTGVVDTGGIDTGIDAHSSDSSVGGVITGGPCISGAAGATAYRIQWIKAGSQAQVSYEVMGLPDHSRDHAGAYGYQIGFTSSYVDQFLAQGGLQLDSSDFVDIELSTVGLSSITKATLSIYGRSFDTTTSGSFNWQTFAGVGQTPTNFVSNIAPYAWYSADMTTEIGPGDASVLIRIKAGPNSDALVVNRIELCLQAN